MLENAEYISEEKARKIGQDFFGDIWDIVLTGENTEESNGQIATYSYSAKADKYDEAYNIFFDVTKRGGYILYMLSSKEIEGIQALKTEQLINIEKTFLKDREYGEMEYIYYEIYEDILFINFASKVGDIIIYPDIIKLKLNLYTGDVVGFESTGYIRSHINRKIPNAKYELKDLEYKLNKDFIIKSIKKVLIPTDINTEALCYEYKGKI